ncbi:hypothetical protein JZ751_027470 [Albula glossodonta]|uniref:Uncharacterized protein n=1 Tax=Albula glossodonta TaxID=121402 RepID=A0A8T2NBY6_9TELE|nr:hypothetical protein JZ751_027470 [Albula glossodonta]
MILLEAVPRSQFQLCYTAVLSSIISAGGCDQEGRGHIHRVEFWSFRSQFQLCHTAVLSSIISAGGEVLDRSDVLDLTLQLILFPLQHWAHMTHSTDGDAVWDDGIPMSPRFEEDVPHDENHCHENTHSNHTPQYDWPTWRRRVELIKVEVLNRSDVLDLTLQLILFPLQHRARVVHSTDGDAVPDRSDVLDLTLQLILFPLQHRARVVHSTDGDPCGEGFVIVPREGVPGIAMILAEAQSVPVALRLQAEMVILSENLPALPVLQHNPQAVVCLGTQPIKVLQAEPVLSIQVSKPLLQIHLVLLPGSEEVDRPILPPLNDGPATLGTALLTPGLNQTVGIAWAQQGSGWVLLRVGGALVLLDVTGCLSRGSTVTLRLLGLQKKRYLGCGIEQQVLQPPLLQSVILLIDEVVQQLGVDLCDSGIHTTALPAQSPDLCYQPPLQLQQAPQPVQLLLLPPHLSPQSSQL